MYKLKSSNQLCMLQIKYTRFMTETLCPWNTSKDVAAAAVTSVVSDSVRPHRQQPTRLRCPWDSPGKNTGMGCHFLLQCMKVKVKLKSLSHVRPSVTPWTAALQAPPSMGLSRQGTGVGCHFLLQYVKVKSESEVAQSCPTLCDPMDCSPPGSSVHGIFQARVLEWGAVA